jgi:DNA-binding XRE family transcriptional regulator
MVGLRLDNRIAKILEASGWRESELAFHCEMDQGHLNRIKHGRVQPNLLTALKISRSLELPVRAVFRLRRSDPRADSEPDA